MALDNLMTDHNHYLQSPYDAPVLASIPGLAKLDEGDLYETAVMFFIVLVGVTGSANWHEQSLSRDSRSAGA